MFWCFHRVAIVFSSKYSVKSIWSSGMEVVPNRSSAFGKERDANGVKGGLSIDSRKDLEREELW
jgi:hypothetical protein